MKEDYSDQRHREKHQNDMKERMSSNWPQESIEPDDDNEISGAEEKLLASLNVENVKLITSSQ